jgi:hypothetical protein
MVLGFNQGEFLGQSVDHFASDGHLDLSAVFGNFGGWKISHSNALLQDRGIATAGDARQPLLVYGQNWEALPWDPAINQLKSDTSGIGRVLIMVLL